MIYTGDLSHRNLYLKKIFEGEMSIKIEQKTDP